MEVPVRPDYFMEAIIKGLDEYSTILYPATQQAKMAAIRLFRFLKRNSLTEKPFPSYIVFALQAAVRTFAEENLFNSIQ